MLWERGPQCTEVGSGRLVRADRRHLDPPVSRHGDNLVDVRFASWPYDRTKNRLGEGPENSGIRW